MSFYTTVYIPQSRCIFFSDSWHHYWLHFIKGVLRCNDRWQVAFHFFGIFDQSGNCMSTHVMPAVNFSFRTSSHCVNFWLVVFTIQEAFSICWLFNDLERTTLVTLFNTSTSQRDKASWLGTAEIAKYLESSTVSRRANAATARR